MAAVRNGDTLERLVETLETNAGDVLDACRVIGVSTGWLKKWMRDDPKVEAAIQDAIDTGATVLESAMISRAVKGWKEPVYYKDELVGHKRKYSDTLLIKALESRKPETYGKKVDMNHNVTVKNMTDSELDSKIEMLMSRLGMKALPAPEEVLDAEFTPVEELSVEDLL